MQVEAMTFDFGDSCPRMGAWPSMGSRCYCAVGTNHTVLFHRAASSVHDMDDHASWVLWLVSRV